MAEVCTVITAEPAPVVTTSVDVQVNTGYKQILRPIDSTNAIYEDGATNQYTKLTLPATTGSYTSVLATAFLYIATDQPVSVKLTMTDDTVVTLAVNQVLVIDSATKGFQLLNTGAVVANVRLAVVGA